jgi:hypothetical protein
MKHLYYILLILFSFTQNVKAQNYLYQQSFDLINNMLEDKTPYSFKNAVFSVENAYLKGALDSLTFNSKIEAYTNLAKLLVENRTLEYQGKDKETVNKYASLFSVMKDSIPILDAKGNEFTYLPFSYDFYDPFGHMDWSSMFVSKLLDTHKGNCHSLPYLYKILAEELGVEAHLALAPNHTYIKHRSERDGWYNTELTSGIFPIDAWLMASGYIHIDAIRNGVYMKALDDKESLALCLVDLAQAQLKEEFIDFDFVIKCANKALEYYPNCVNAMILVTESKGKQIELMLEARNKDFTSVNQYEDTRKIFLDIQDRLGAIHKLGYRQMPEEMYLDWLVSLKEEKEKYANKKINTFNNTTD